MQEFYALVGPTGAGKTTVMNELKRRRQGVFLCDSSGSSDPTLPHVGFTRRVTELARSGVHRDTTPRSQLLLFWSRLVVIIEKEVLPALQQGKAVIIDGFGGTVYVNAALSARSPAEREEILELHKDMIRHCVVGLGVPPPIYLWLKPSAEVALRRLTAVNGTSQLQSPLEAIETINREFEFYGTLPGQTVVPITANGQVHDVVDAALEVMDYYKQVQAAE